MLRKVPPSLYAPARPWQIEAQLRRGVMPSAFTRRMRVLNLISATTLMKIEDRFLLPFDVMDLHHILDKQISQDAIIDQLNNDELSYALATGNIDPLIGISDAYPLLLKGLQSGWIQRFIYTPFDPLCVMLAMRARLMLDLIDELGHSYNLIRSLGYGFIDFGDIPDEEPGDPGDYYPPVIDDPIDPPPDYPTPDPGEPGYVEPGPEPGEPGYEPPAPPLPPGTDPMSPPWNVDPAPGSLGGAARPGGKVTPEAADPCADKDDPLETVTFSYTTQQMAISETQDFAVTGNHPRWSASNYVWKLTGGGGTLDIKDSDPLQRIFGPEESEYDEDATLGAFEVQYTAPDTNPYCDLNPTVELWCGGALMASLTIAVNADEDGAFIINFEDCFAGEWCPPYEASPGRSCLCYIFDIHGCDGGFLIHKEYAWEEQCGCLGVDEGQPCTPDCEPKDIRSEAAIQAGCCPEALL